MYKSVRQQKHKIFSALIINIFMNKKLSKSLIFFVYIWYHKICVEIFVESCQFNKVWAS